MSIRIRALMRAEQTTLENALIVAAVRYEADAELMACSTSRDYARVQTQFRKQATEARALHAKLVDCDRISYYAEEGSEA